MCFAVKCNKCGKTTWKGCGMHVEQVMKDVPKSQQCECPREGSSCIISNRPVAHDKSFVPENTHNVC
ncbi:hypothetical protein K457DRAFT_142927 [Linnemannia elongata AG-77]|uniref:Uncharacterized protein n=1 Tax=Linnemannia elongata AG-77 TaxID=1314771 RepID=A0A197JFI4_9FUNG|nr:hypothetical protein K457DRAFT_142927 [Linnemannia elongata AG-77]